MLSQQQKKPKSNNEKLIIGIIIGSVLGFLIYWSSNVVSIYSETLFIILVALVIFIALLLLILTWFRNKIIRKFFGKDIEFDNLLKETQETIHVISDKAIQTLPIEDEKRKKVKFFAPKLINYILWSNFRNWGLKIFTSFVLGLGGIVTTILIINQNKLFEIQNKRIEQQTHLIESGRRSAQIFIMGEVLSDMNNELTSTVDTISNTLAGRIISLSLAMKPYRYLEGDSLTKRPLSPERGQLLTALIASGLESDFLQRKIYKTALFEYSDLKNTVYFNTDFTNIKFDHANFSRARLDSSVFYNTHLQYSDFTNAFLSNTDFTKAKLYRANFKNAKISSSTNFEDALLIESNLEGLALGSVNLKGANLTNAKLKGVDFSDLKCLDSVKIDRFHWISYIKDSLHLKGSEEIEANYYVDSIIRFPGSGKLPMLLRKKLQ